MTVPVICPLEISLAKLGPLSTPIGLSSPNTSLKIWLIRINPFSSTPLVAVTK